MDTPPLINEGGVSLTGERMALGRGKSLEDLTVDTICTGLPTSPVTTASLSEMLEDSLPESPDSLALDELELLDEEEELFLPLFFTEVEIRGGILADEVVVT